MTPEDAKRILGDGANGITTFNDDFKEACRMGQQAILALERLGDKLPLDDRKRIFGILMEGKP